MDTLTLETLPAAPVPRRDSENAWAEVAGGTRLPVALREAIGTFVAWEIANANLRPNTIKHYGHDLLLFARYCERGAGRPLTVAEVTSGRVRSFLAHLEAQGNNGSTRRRRLAALRRFFGAMIDLGYVDSDPTKNIETRAVKPTCPVILTREECLRLLEAAKTTHNPARDHAIFRLFLTSGCTLSELVGLKTCDVDLTDGWVRFVGRGGVSRTVPLSAGAGGALERYLAIRAKAPADPHALFLNRLGRPVTKGAVYHAFHRVLRAAGIRRPDVTIHTLRHTSLAFLWRAGVSLQILKHIAGHRSLASTRGYSWAGTRPAAPQPWTGNHPLDDIVAEVRES